MAVQRAMLLLITAVVGCVAAQTQSPYPILPITKGQPLPVLKELQPDASGWVTLDMQPATIVVRNCPPDSVIRHLVTSLPTVGRGS